MPDKNCLVVLDVDLECHRCEKKIKKVLNNYLEKGCIESVSYEKDKSKVKLTGAFDAEKLVKKLCKKACEAIREWHILPMPDPPKPKPEPPKPEPPKPKPEPPKPKPEPPKPEPPKPKPEPPKPEPPKPEPPKPEPPKPEPPKPKPEPPKPDPPKPEPPKPKPACPEPLPPNCYPYPYPYPYPLSYFYPASGCEGHKPCSCGGHCGGYRLCACGCGGGCSGPYQPAPAYPDYGRPCHWVCEEENPGGCNVM